MIRKWLAGEDNINQSKCRPPYGDLGDSWISMSLPAGLLLAECRTQRPAMPVCVEWR